jgi:hypothetical protein
MSTNESTLGMRLREAIARAKQEMSPADDEAGAPAPVVTAPPTVQAEQKASTPTPPADFNNTHIVMWYVKHNPGITGVQLREALKADGFDFWQDASSYLNQNFKAGRLTRKTEHIGGEHNNRTYSYRVHSGASLQRKKTVVRPSQPVSTPSLVKPAQEIEQIKEILASIPTYPVEVPMPVHVPRETTRLTAKEVLDRLSIAEAAALYKELANLFGK